MADVAGRPFLELLLRQLRRHGFERAILAVGYQKDMIYSHFGERAFGLDLAYSVESCPLGTGGALRNAADLIESENVLIMNGDSYTDADLGEFVVDHREAKADALCSCCACRWTQRLWIGADRWKTASLRVLRRNRTHFMRRTSMPASI